MKISATVDTVSTITLLEKLRSQKPLSETFSIQIKTKQDVNYDGKNIIVRWLVRRFLSQNLLVLLVFYHVLLLGAFTRQVGLSWRQGSTSPRIPYHGNPTCLINVYMKKDNVGVLG